MINRHKRSLILGVLIVTLCLPVQAKQPKQATVLQKVNQKIRSSGILNCFSIRQLEFFSQYTYLAALVLFIIDHEKSGKPLMTRETLSRALLFTAGGLLTREILECFITHDSKNSVQYLANEQEEKVEVIPQVTVTIEPMAVVAEQQSQQTVVVEVVEATPASATQEQLVVAIEPIQQPEEQVQENQVVEIIESQDLTNRTVELNQPSDHVQEQEVPVQV